jgi:hypothetical protein
MMKLMRRKDNADPAIKDTEKDNRRKNKHAAPTEQPSKNKTSITVSSTIKLEESLRLSAPRLYRIPLVPVNCSFGIVTEKEDKKIPLQRMTQRERRATGSDVTVIFAIRRPGCMMCREHGLQLTELAKQENVCVVGAIKETGAHNAALLDFYQTYFHFPIYKDTKWDIFHAMGGRKIRIWDLLKNMSKTKKRCDEKNIVGIPFGGDMWTQGGVLIFDKHGELRHCLYETCGDELDMNELRQAIQEARRSPSSLAESSPEDSSTEHSITEHTITEHSSTAHSELSE